MNVKKFMLSFGLAGGIIFGTANCLAVDISISQLEKVQVTENKVVGYFEVENNENIYYPELFYVADLCKTTVAEGGLSFIEEFYEYDASNLELKAGEEKKVYFDYELPSNLEWGSYKLKIELFSKTEHLKQIKYLDLGYIGKDNSGSLVTTEFPYWLINNKKIGAYDGPNFYINENPVGFLGLRSTFSETKEFIPEITVYKRLKVFNDEPIRVTKGNKVTLNPGEAKNIEIKFPSFDVPESYLAKVIFLDKDGNKVSNEYEFRYVVKGASAKILSVKCEYVNEDNSVDISIEAIGPADNEILENCQITYNLYNVDNGKLIGSEELFTDLGTESKMLKKNVRLNDTVSNVRVEANVLYNDVELATNNTDIEVKHIINDPEDSLFKDIKGTKYYTAVKALNDFGILSGYPDGTYRADNNIKRSEFTVIAIKMAGIEVVPTGDTKFDDVSNDHWAKDIINLAYDNNIISGYGNGLFKPDNEVSYQEALTILINVLGLKEEMANSSLNWPDNYIEKSNELGLMKNVNMFNLANYAKRGNIALMTYETYLKLQ